MPASSIDETRVRAAWAGRVAGCILGKPLEVLSFKEGPSGVRRYLEGNGAWPLRDYVPSQTGTLVAELGRGCCRGEIRRAEADDDLNYSVLALLLLEAHGAELATENVARAWLRHLPAGTTWTAERAAYRMLLNEMDDEFVNGAAPGFDLARCSANPYSDWIGAQIRADVYGWACPGAPERAAELARRDASLSHRGDGVHGAVFVAALGAALAASEEIDEAIEVALAMIPSDSGTAGAVRFALDVVGKPDALVRIHARYGELPPVHAVNNLAIVVWAFAANRGDFSAAIGDAVAAGWDTDCNGATVGGLCGIAGFDIPEHWSAAWAGEIAVDLGSVGTQSLDDLAARTVAVAHAMETSSHAH